MSYKGLQHLQPDLEILVVMLMKIVILQEKKQLNVCVSIKAILN